MKIHREMISHLSFFAFGFCQHLTSSRNDPFFAARTFLTVIRQFRCQFWDVSPPYTSFNGEDIAKKLIVLVKIFQIMSEYFLIIKKRVKNASHSCA